MQVQSPPTNERRPSFQTTLMSLVSRNGSTTEARDDGNDPNDPDHDSTHRIIVSPPQDESLLHRAGLLQPRSYVSFSSGSSRTSMPYVQPRSQGDIRASTVQLSNIPVVMGLGHLSTAPVLPTPGSSSSFGAMTSEQGQHSESYSNSRNTHPSSSSCVAAATASGQDPSVPSLERARHYKRVTHDGVRTPVRVSHSRDRDRDSFIFPGSNVDSDVDEDLDHGNTQEYTRTGVESQTGTHIPSSFHHLAATSFVPSSRFSLGAVESSEDLTASTLTFDSAQTVQTSSTDSTTAPGMQTPRSSMGSSTPRDRHRPHSNQAPSTLSILLARQLEAEGGSGGGEYTPRGTQSLSPRSITPTLAPGAEAAGATALQTPDAHVAENVNITTRPDERTPLLPAHTRSLPTNGNGNGNPASGFANGHSTGSDHPKNSIPHAFSLSLFSKALFSRSGFGHTGESGRGGLSVDVAGLGKKALKSIPAVVLGTLLNILDGVSYGMIIFPATGVFASLGGMGVSMFFVSTVIAQLVYTLGGSNFAGANGSMMIEVVPFFHILASTIARDIAGDTGIARVIGGGGEEALAREIIATTLVAFALSSLLTGLTFFLLGYLRLGVLVGFFPRHILVGCIGGVGIFLILTGLTVSTRLPSDALDPPTLATLRYFALDPHALAQWVPPALLAVLLRVITTRWKHQLVFPIYFLIIPIIFYIVVAAAQLDLSALRRDGWLFDTAQTGGGVEDKWYGFYTYYDWRAVRWAPIWATLPTQLALLFFNVLHPPLNVPALCFMLALATFALLIIGTAPIAFIPVMVVSALIFVLGIDLVKEALWDTRHRVSRMEYITIISIMVTMTVWDFVIGVLFGIVVSCFFFVVQNSQRRSIRACYTGDATMSTVRRPAAHRAYIREVSKQTRILLLQGFLFFGTIAHVEDTLRSIVNDPVFRTHPVRFVVVDFSMVAGVDMSSAEAFVRVQRLLAAKGVVLVFCGVSRAGVGKALGSVGILEEPYVELFGTLNDAMEWTENAYLYAWFRAQKKETSPVVLPGRQQVDVDFHESLAGSPRGLQLRDVGDRTIASDRTQTYSSPHTSELLATEEVASEPFNTLLKAFASYDTLDRSALASLAPYFEQISAPEGYVLWEKDEPSDGLYIIQSGVLRASYKFAEHTPVIEESMVSGTLAGELSALSGLPRNARVVVERQAVLWKLSSESMRKLEEDHPHLAQRFVRLVLKGEFYFLNGDFAIAHLQKWTPTPCLQLSPQDEAFFWSRGQNAMYR
ncbi:hypothetical protein HYDPIDRAFT_165880 [Hydnomerulius pinastri MD-312]|nr:hypothetical protein HYDPIDRAFT_165880 [Hydnomerulius pinastri MD-312]